LKLYTKILLASVFISSILLVVYLQFNTSRSINQLIRGNEDLINELQVKSQTEVLQKNIASLENKVKSAVIEDLPDTRLIIDSESEKIKTTFHLLDTLKNDSSIAPLLDELHKLIEEKIAFNVKITEIFNTDGKESAEAMINTHLGSLLSDSIRANIRLIDIAHRENITSLIEKADRNGQNAKTLGTIMGLIAAMASVFTFGYIAYKMREQQQLISLLKTSEQKALDAATIKEKFLANMSHEIRTPLNIILGFTQQLQKKKLDPDIKEEVEIIEQSGNSLLSIVNDILDLSKIEAGMMRIEKAGFSIRDTVQNMEKMFAPRAAAKGLHFNVHIDSSIPNIVIGDAERLMQILVNLVGNAIKFTEHGSIAIRIIDQGKINTNIKLGIVVSDTGLGIAPQKIQNIFKRFSQSDNALSRKYGGTGLGLSIVHELVTLQDGSLQVESEPMKGTTFILSIPYDTSFAIQAIGTTEKEPENNFIEWSNYKILIAEDNTMNRLLLNKIFTGWGLKFDEAKNGLEVIDYLQQQDYDLLLMDVQMPEMDGYQTTEEIRNKLQLTIPVIAMTAHAMPGEKDKCIAHGMSDYIAKPIRERELFTLLQKWLRSLKKDPPISFSTINLSYMRSISLGNIDFEKKITQDFIHCIPIEINTIKQYQLEQNITALRQAAHNFKTTISIMGLTEKLTPTLDDLEYKTLNDSEFNKLYRTLEKICTAALEEAKQFYTSLL